MPENGFTKGMALDTRDKQYKVRLFRKFFSGLDHVYGTYDPRTGRSWQVKASVTDGVILKHLIGRKPYGVYLLTGDCTRAAAVDFDQENLALPMDFVEAADHCGLPTYIERSKSKGYHVWMFFSEQGVPAAKARLVVNHILDEIRQPGTEIFPRQDSLSPGACDYGHFINAPLYGRLVRKGRTAFLDPVSGLQPYTNQWSFLERVNPTSEGLLDEIIDVNELAARRESNSEDSMSLGVFKAPYAIPPCTRRMLEEGVTTHQRVSCFRIAVQLRKVGLPFDLVVAALSEWSKKNRPENGRRRITHREIKAQAAAAFLKEYRGCGCEEPAMEPFCDVSCPLYRNRNRPRSDEVGGKHAGIAP